MSVSGPDYWGSSMPCSGTSSCSPCCWSRGWCSYRSSEVWCAVESRSGSWSWGLEVSSPCRLGYGLSDKRVGVSSGVP